MRTRIEGWAPARTSSGDEEDFTTGVTFEAPVDGFIQFDGIATLAAVFVDGVKAAQSSSMWVPVRIPVAAGVHSIVVRCRALAPELAKQRRPRARWRQKITVQGNLRWFRTTLHGRTPALSPTLPVVGLWRDIWFVADEPFVTVRTQVDDCEGQVFVTTDLPDGTPVSVSGVEAIIENGRACVRVPSPQLWWPHTHGEPHLYTLEVNGRSTTTRLGFRTISSATEILREGLRPQINGCDVFIRGAVWTPVPESELRSTLETARQHGLNAVRLAGTMYYETQEFHDLCDELGILVWQDLMFANFDYPFSDPDFRNLVDRELQAVIENVAGRPSTFCVCGNSEIEQQVAMYGQSPSLARSAFFDHDVPTALVSASADVLYVPSAPCGADRPMIASQGVSNWFGVGAYKRSPNETRHADVRFASECLAFSNIGDVVEDPNAPAWKSGVPRDKDADWDFENVRDHYLRLLYGVDPAFLRTDEPERWIALSRQVTGDIMAEVFGEWRRSASVCSGGFVLWLRDLHPGPGWGLLDHAGAPKQALRALAPVLAPVAIWMTDEGMSGYAVHVANDRPEPLTGTIKICLLRGDQTMSEAEVSIGLQGRSSWVGDVETIIGRWVDVSYAYRFGPPSHDLVIAQLLTEDGTLLGEGRRFPLGREKAA